MTGRRTDPTWTTQGTASVVSLRPLLAFARARRIDVARLLALANIAPSIVDDYDSRIPEAARARIWVAAAEQSADPLFGLHVADQSQLGMFDVLDYALYFSSTVGEGLRHIERFHRILCDAWALDIEQRGNTVRLRRIERTPPPECECAFATLVRRAHALTTADVPPLEVRFAHRSDTDPARYVEWFRCPVRFGAPASELIINAADLSLPVPSGNTGVQRIIERYMIEMLERVPRTASFVELARAAVARRLRDSLPTLAQTARELHASPRTLQRKLREHGVSYRELVESVRRDAAERLLAEGRASVTEIAFLLGFSDVSGFRRLYKRWTGVSPASAARVTRAARRS